MIHLPPETRKRLDDEATEARWVPIRAAWLRGEDCMLETYRTWLEIAEAVCAK